MTLIPLQILRGTRYLNSALLISLMTLTGCGSSSSDESIPSENQDTPTQVEQAPSDDNEGTIENPQANLPTDGQSNILLIIADDLGVDNISLYNEQPDYMAETPSIDAIANNGVLFRNAWANPMCSPSRASIYTGLHAYNHGVLTPGNSTDQEFSAGILTQAGYKTALFGKWHLGGGRHTAEQQGFEYFSGTKDNLTSYFDWTKEVRNSDGSIDTTQAYTGNNEQNYATTVTATDAIDWINNQTSPWFATVAFHAGHSPLHVPPNVGNRRDLSGEIGEDCDTSGNTNQQCFRAMVEVMDHYIGDILDQVDTSNTVIIFVADNGPAAGTVYQQDGTPFIRTHSKGTVYEGGINVPLIIGAGENITLNSGEENALIQVQDIFSTVLDIANATSANTVDGQTLRPYLDANQESNDRTMLYSELFSDSGTANTVDGDDNNYWAVLDASSQVKYLYVEDANETDEKCFDLSVDITEEINVFDISGDASNTCNQLKTQRPCLATDNCPTF
ncbi:MAG: sulfatase-like hydrolase/transferase [Bermanella sp.]